MAVRFLKLPVRCSSVAAGSPAVPEDGGQVPRTSGEGRGCVILFGMVGFARLSPRERDVLLLISHGLNVKAVATRLNLSPKTIQTHRSHIGVKIGVRTLSEMADYERKRSIGI